MIAEQTILRGTFQNGLIVPERPLDLPDGTQVQITLPTSQLTLELLAELAEWETASSEAWSMMDRWEAEDAE